MKVQRLFFTLLVICTVASSLQAASTGDSFFDDLPPLVDAAEGLLSSQPNTRAHGQASRPMPLAIAATAAAGADMGSVGMRRLNEPAGQPASTASTAASVATTAVVANVITKKDTANEKLTCSVCYEDIDNEKRFSAIKKPCTTVVHSVCEKCFIDHIANNDFLGLKCPMCRTTYSQENLDSAYIPFSIDRGPQRYIHPHHFASYARMLSENKLLASTLEAERAQNDTRYSTLQAQAKAAEDERKKIVADSLGLISQLSQRDAQITVMDSQLNSMRQQLKDTKNQSRYNMANAAWAGLLMGLAYKPVLNYFFPIKPRK